WEATARDEDDELELVGEVIERCRRAGTELGNIAVLAPYRFRFSGLWPILETRDISYVYIGSEEMERCPIMRVVRACLTGLANPDRPLQVAAVIDAANQAAGREWLNEDSIKRTVLVASQAPPEQLHAILVNQLSLADFAGEATPSELRSRLKRFRQMLGLAVTEEESVSSAMLADMVLFEWSRLETAVLRSEQAVKIMTTFNAKGLEFDTVILPFCTKNLMPYIPSGQRGNTHAWYEARRNFYVALTRSTNRVVFTRVTGLPRSIFLDEIPADLLQTWSR
ncbi:MAG: 3'-5' exonuclease, partial [Vicinamibacterales bacterium]